MQIHCQDLTFGDAEVDYDSMPDYQNMPQEYWDSIPQVDTDAFQQVYGHSS